jgi:HTH-type transcriptional regulator/antitoxin HigA
MGAGTAMEYKKVASAEPPKTIHTDQENRHWRNILNALMSRPEEELSKAEARYGETIAVLIEAYEKTRYSLAETSPIDVLQSLMVSNNLKQKDLEDVFGSEAAVSYALSGKRPMNVHQIRRLAAKFHVSPAVFV